VPAATYRTNVSIAGPRNRPISRSLPPGSRFTAIGGLCVTAAAVHRPTRSAVLDVPGILPSTACRTSFP